MAHFAKLGANGKVIQVLTLDNKDMLNACLLYTSPSPRDS